MADKTWKRRERASAAYWHGRRTPLSGANSGHGTAADVLGVPGLFVEVKARAAIALLRIWDKVATTAAREGRRPVLHLYENGRKGGWLLLHEDDLHAVAHAKAQGDIAALTEKEEKPSPKDCIWGAPTLADCGEVGRKGGRHDA